MFARRAIVLLVLSLFASLPLQAGFSGRELILPAVGRVDGFGGSHFYTTVWMTNPSSVRADVRIEFLVAGQTKIYENIAETLFGMKGILGAARFRSTTDLIVAARIYNQPTVREPRIRTASFSRASRPSLESRRARGRCCRGSARLPITATT